MADRLHHFASFLGNEAPTGWLEQEEEVEEEEKVKIKRGRRGKNKDNLMST